MPNIDITEAQAWIEPTKLTLSSLDTALEAQIASQIFTRLAVKFDTTSWLNPASTPAIVRSIIAMYYVAWVYDKYYSDDAEANEYALRLRQYADINIAGMVGGDIVLPETPTAVTQPAFFPNDASSANEPTSDNPSDGPPSFTMGTVF